MQRFNARVMEELFGIDVGCTAYTAGHKVQLPWHFFGLIHQVFDATVI